MKSHLSSLDLRYKLPRLLLCKSSCTFIKYAFPTLRSSFHLPYFSNRLPLYLNSSQYQLRLKRGWYKDIGAWLNHSNINKNIALQNINNIKNIVTSKFKEKLWCENDPSDLNLCALKSLMNAFNQFT